MDENLPNGFVPRINSLNYQAVERVTGRVRSLFEASAPPLAWAVVDGPWAARTDAFRAHARDVGLSYLIDTQGWRSNGEEVPARWAEMSHAPRDPLWQGDTATDRTFIRSDLAFQALNGAAAFLIPGPLPAAHDHPTRDALIHACAVAQDVVLEHSKPAFAFLGVHTDNLDEARRTVAALPRWISGIYVQFTPVNPMRDSVSKTARMLDFLLETADEDLHVMGGHLGAIDILASALGIHATDAGLASGEQFRVQNWLTKRTGGPGKPGQRRGRPRYLDALLGTVPGQVSFTLESIPTARAAVLCGPECCRYYTSEQRLNFSREHTLRERLRASTEVRKLPGSMRPDHVHDRLQRARAAVATVNGALRAVGEQPLEGRYLENQLAVLEHLGHRKRLAS